jgi:hypothetical protein
MRKLFLPFTRTIAGALVAGAFLLPCQGFSAKAQDAPLLRLAHYSTGNGLIGFVLDRTGTPPKIRFDGSKEIVALSAVPAVRGVTSLRQDDGWVLLRVDDSGAVMLFSRPAGDGVPAFVDQEALPLDLLPASKTRAEDEAASMSRQINAATGLNLPFSLEGAKLDDSPSRWAAMADATMVVGMALGDIAESKLGHDALAAKVERVAIRDEGRPAIALDGKTLVISVATDRPFAGRPSSALIKSKLGDLL